VDVDVAREFNIQAMPTFISIHNGNIIERFEGASKDKLRVMVDTLNAI
jgi:thioredoxin-like negative regulator of GroEL